MYGIYEVNFDEFCNIGVLKRVRYSVTPVTFMFYDLHHAQMHHLLTVMYMRIA